MIRDAQNAENEANQKIAEEQASARQRAESAQKKAEATVLQRRTCSVARWPRWRPRPSRSRTRRRSAAETARSSAEQELQKLRSELEKTRLQCDVVLPAEAARQAAQARARGEAAPLVENGKAAAAALKAVATEWKAAGQGGREVYLLQQLRASSRPRWTACAQTQLGELQIVDGGRRPGLRRLRGQLPGRGIARHGRDGPRGRGGRPLPARLEGRGAVMPVLAVLAVTAFIVCHGALVDAEAPALRQHPERGAASSPAAPGGSATARWATARSAAGAPLRMPLFELVDKVDLTNIPIDIEVKGPTQGRDPAERPRGGQREAAREEPLLNNAIERFLGRGREDILLIAKETLEGNLRGVLALLTPEEVNQDKVRFAPDAARRGRARPQPHGPRPRHPQDPEHHRRRGVPQLHRPHPGRPGAHGGRHRGGGGQADAAGPAGEQLVRVRDRQGRRRPRHRPPGDARSASWTRRRAAKP